jgi:predicted permease
MSTLLQDLKSARRLLTKNPTFTIVAVLTLGLGIGLNTAVFSAIEALLLRPLPGVRAPGELVQIYREWPGIEYGSSSPMTAADLRARAPDAFTEIASWGFVPVSVAVDGEPSRLYGQIVSANYFSLLGAVPHRGRFFVAAEDQAPGAHPVIVISHAMWQTVFGGDPGAVGRNVTLNGQPYVVVGVAAPELRSPIPVISPALWVPLMQLDQVAPGSAGALTSRDNNFLSMIARLRPGVTPSQAQARVDAALAGLIAEFPDDYRGSEFRLILQEEAGIHPQVRGAQLGLSAIVMAVVVMLLLIACVNVANLFLARSRDRWREMAVRLSLGARRAVLVRQLLTESVVFAIAAGLVGLAMAWGCMRLLNSIQLPIDAQISANVQLSTPVLAFALLVTLGTVALFGLAPALHATRPALVPALKGDSPVGDSRSRASRGLVVAQMALSLVLLVSAGLFLRNLGKATTIDKGFDDSNLLLAELDPELQGYSRPRSQTFFRTVAERLSALPNVAFVGWSSNVPLGLSNSQNGVVVPGYTPAENEQMSIDYNIVSAGYFDAMGITMLRGRGFEPRDDSAATPVVVVNQRFAERFWPGQDPIGKTVTTRGADRTVIGVTPTGKYRTLGEPALAYLYLHSDQVPQGAMFLHVRTTQDPSLLVPVVRSEVAALDADMPVTNVRTMASHLGIALFPSRLAGAALGVFGLLGLLLASVGIYGVMAYSVAQRTRELGIRMAVGASRATVVGFVLKQGLALVAIGGGIGLAVSLAAAQLIKGVLYGGGAVDLVTFTAVPLILTVVATLAILIPARRAASVDPIRAIRADV